MKDCEIKCPKCGKPIDYLDNLQTGMKTYRMDKQGNYKALYFNSDGFTNMWVCPLCDEELFRHESEAIDFLKGRKEDKQNDLTKYAVFGVDYDDHTIIEASSSQEAERLFLEEDCLGNNTAFAVHIDTIKAIANKAVANEAK